jgi:hypothetical protein
MRVVLVIGMLCAASSAVASEDWTEHERVELGRGGTRATIVELRSGMRSTVEVTLTRHGKTAAWRSEDLWLDPERTGWPLAEAHETKDGLFLFVRTYTRGAHCCWGFLVFDMRRLASRGLQLASEGSVELVKGRRRCALGAAGSFWMPGRLRPEQGVRCFAQGRFEGAGSDAFTAPERVER